MEATARIDAVDRLRGWAIFGMALSGMVPWNSLPAWMYHAQLPPPSRAFDANTFGITWVDLVFPFFLFALGAAIPLALGGRLDRGEEPIAVGMDVLRRGFFLAAFAVVVQHFRPASIDLPAEVVNWVVIGLFVLMVLAWCQPPRSAPSWVRLGLVGVGVGGVIACLLLIPFKPEPNFLATRVDIILLVLANVAVSGGLIWLLFRGRNWVMLALAGAVTAIFLTATLPGAGKVIWDWSPFPWLYRFEFHKYLLIVIPGIWCGERLRTLRAGEGGLCPWPLVIGLMLTVVCLVGLLERTVAVTCLTSAVVAGLGMWLARRRPVAERQILAVGSAMLIIGLLAEPIGGGIRKDSATISNFLVTSGLACWLCAGWQAISGWQPTWRSFPAAVGRAPMVAYVAITAAVPGLIRVTGLHSWVGDQGWSPWALVGYGVFQTVLVGLVAVGVTRLGLRMRA